MIPASAKGKGKASVRRPVPISADLAVRLRQASDSRPAAAPLLSKPSGQPWRKSDHARLFTRAAVRCDLDPNEVTIYALRHSSIVRQLRAGLPVRLVAAAHDTSSKVIETHYSGAVVDLLDDLMAGTVISLLSQPTGDEQLQGDDNIVPLRTA